MLIFFYIVFGNFFNFNFLERLPIKLAEFFSLFLFVLFALRIFYKKIKGVSFQNRTIWLWLLIAFVSSTINFVVNKYGLTDYIYGISYIFRLIHLVLLIRITEFFIEDTEIGKTKLLNFVINCYMIVCIIGFIQLLLFPTAIDWYTFASKFGGTWADPDPHQGRLLSTYHDPNYLASVIIIPTGLIISKIMIKNEFKNIENSDLIKLAVLLITLVLTESRTSLVGFAILMIALILYYGLNKKIPTQVYIALLALILVGILFVMFGDVEVINKISNVKTDDSAKHRFDSWNEAFSIFKKNFVYGIGYNLYAPYNEMMTAQGVVNTSSYGLDSSVLFAFVTTGLFGGIVFLKIMYDIIKAKIYNYAYIGVKAILLASIIMSFFNNLLFYTLWIFPFAIVVFAAKTMDKEINNEFQQI